MTSLYGGKREEAEGLNDLDIHWLHEHGYLADSKWGGITWKRGNHESSVGLRSCLWSDGKYIRIWYTQTDRQIGKSRDFAYNLQLVSTNCNYGGARYWLVCPLRVEGKVCGRRVGVLYKGGDYFGCRRCYKLSYRTQNENRRSSFYPISRFLGDAQKARELRASLKRQNRLRKPK